MKVNCPEKEGFDCGLGRVNTSVAPRDEAVWADKRNWEQEWLQRPYDGLDATTWDAVMQHGVSIDNVQKSINAKASVKDE